MFGEDFSNRDLRNEKLAGGFFANDNFQGSILPANLEDANFCNASLAGVWISLRCKSFEHIKVDPGNFKMALFLMSLMDVQGHPKEVELENLQRLLTSGHPVGYRDILLALLNPEDIKNALAQARMDL